MKDDLIALLGLQRLDSALARLQQEYGALDRGEEEQKALEAAQAAEAGAEAALHSANGEMRDAELELKTVETKRAEVEKKLYSGTVRVPKEMQAMQEEIEMLARQRARLDERILTLMDLVETRKREAAEARTLRSQADEKLKQKKTDYRQTAERMVTEAKAFAAERGTAAKSIPPALLKQYDHLRATRGGLGVVPLVEQRSCGGCRMALSSNFIEEVKAGTAPAICENCGRIVADAKGT
jgi:predicted  nucleic acid-binding Zn-ribbon protein